ncbi:MAG TPA: hypothetical protein VF092_23730 [Longimicrobium sp.]
MDESLPRLDKKAFSVVPAFEEDEEIEYWLTRTPIERLRHVETLRRMNYGALATARLQRVLELVKVPWG